MKGQDDGKKLGFGFMRLPVHDPKDPGTVIVEEATRLVDAFMDAGFNYFDTSWIYHNFKSESFVRDLVVKRYPRDKIQISSKLPLKFIQNPTVEEQERIFKEQMENCGVDYFDTFLVHSINKATYPIANKIGTFQFLYDKTKEGVIGRFGISTHDDPEFMDMLLTEHPEVEFVYLQINYLDWDNPTVRAREMWEVAQKHGKYILVMEPCKGGMLAQVPPEAEKLMKDYNPDASIASWAIRYAASVEGVDRVMSGMSTMEQVEDNIKSMKEFKPLNDEELGILKKVSDIINATTKIPCTHCNYCLSRCPKKIPIPDYFMIENDYNRYSDPNHVASYVGYYQNISATQGKAGECIGCKRCEQVCPQGLTIVDYLKDVSEHFDGITVNRVMGDSKKVVEEYKA